MTITTLLIIVFLLLCMLYVVFHIEIKPYMLQKFTRRYYMMSNDISLKNYKIKVFDKALVLAKREKPKMSLADNTYFPIVLMRNITTKIKGNNRLKNSFPRAFLLNGLLDYALSTNSEINNVESIIKKFADDVINNSNELKYIDQVSMGMAALKLYEKTNNSIYKNLCDEILTYIFNNVDKQYDIVLYRKNKDYHYVDVLGMICPFILMYGNIFKRYDLIEFSNHQIEFYINNGLSISGLPYHSIELKNSTPMGSSNWGRGLGWYMLALSATLKYTNDENNNKYSFFKEKMDLLVSNLENFKQDHYWGQFLGLSKKWHSDTSVSCMIIYSILLSGHSIDFRDFYQFIVPLTKKNGAVDFTSGDTEDINYYSREFGESELTQGLLLSIFKIENDIIL